ncbi:MAG: nitrate reductase [Deltaproteobacteria bacterium RIFOXYB12_FULL_58_9]|nr:MAG: nitrate reductase [Deltaproteobacteria bacterium RIFOXYB12_FULL_58_9]
MSMLNRRQFIQIGAGTAGVAALSGASTNWWGLDKNPLHDPGTEGEKIIPTFCELCFWKCGVLAHVKDGRVTKLKGNPAHPLSLGKLCPRGVGGTGLLYDPDRLKTPLIRRQSKRGEQLFEEATWEEALDLMANKMGQVREKYGPEAIALFSHGFGGAWFSHFFKAIGTPNISAPSYAQCRGPREVGYYLTYGQGCGSPENIDIENARCITLIGSHLGENMHNTQVQEFADAMANGAQLVVVDPRFSTAAGKARYWLPIKPGTDIALLLAWMHVIIIEKRYDIDYIDKHAAGFTELREHIADKTPEWAHVLTGIRPELIRETARFISSFKPASLIHPGRRTTWYGDDTQRARAMAILAALLGSWGRRGGYLNTSKLDVPGFPYTTSYPEHRPQVDRPKPSLYPLADEVLASGVCDATIPGTSSYDIKAWVVYGTNLIQCLPNPRQTKKAIQELDFIASIDVLPSEICGWSDVVLPESTYLERCDEVWTPDYKVPFLAVRQPVVEPMYNSKPGWWIAKELAKRSGLEDYFPWKDSVEYAKFRVTAAGYDCDELQRTGVIVGQGAPTCEEEGLALSFSTDSGKIDLYSKPLAALGFDPLPQYTPPDEAPAGMFRLLFGRAPVHTFGRTVNNRFLSLITNDNEVWVNAKVARDLTGVGILKTGDRVVLINQDGVRSEPIAAKVTERIRGDCVYMIHGYGHSAKGLRFARGRGASDSELVTQYKVDPIMGGTGMNVNFVRIERATQADEAGAARVREGAA